MSDKPGTRLTSPEPGNGTSKDESHPPTGNHTLARTAILPTTDSSDPATGNVTRGDSKTRPSSPTSQDRHLKFLLSCAKVLGQPLPSLDALSSAQREELIAIIEPHMVRANGIRDAYNDHLCKCGAEKIGKGLYDDMNIGVDSPNSSKAIAAKTMKPHHPAQMVVVISNKVVRFEPGENPQLDTFQEARRLEQIACASSALAILKSWQVTPLKK